MTFGYHFFWKVTRSTPLAVNLWFFFASEWIRKRRNERVYRTPNADFPGFSLRDRGLWPLGQIFWKMTQTTRIAVNLRTCASESTGERRHEMVHRSPRYRFSCFFRSVTLTYDLSVNFFSQTTLIAVNLRAFANESTGKRRNEMVHRTPKRRFSFFFAPWPWPVAFGSKFLMSDANYSDCN